MKRQIARLISILLITAMTATFLPSEYYAATLREKMIVSSVYNIPIEVLNTRPAEEIDELFDGIANIESVETSYYEYVYDNEGIPTSYLRTEQDYLNYAEALNDPNANQLNESGTSPTSWMSITLVTQNTGNWNCQITASFHWLIQPAILYNSMDMISLSWENGYYIQNSASGYSSSYYSGGQHTSGLNVVTPDSHVVTCLEEMNNYDVRSNIFFYLTAQIRKVYSKGNERIYAVYGHQKLNITWQDLLSIGCNSTIIAMHLYAYGIGGTIFIVDNVADLLWTLSNIDTKYETTTKQSTISMNANTSLAKIEGFVIRLYEDCLGRQPDISGLDNWVSALYYNGASGGTVAYGFFFSTEYQNLGKSNTDYVCDLYIVLLDRNPDQSGLSSWVSALNTGYTREDVFYGFANSPEFSSLCSSYGIQP